MNSVNHTHMHEATIDEIVITVVMARVTDFFGFFVYAIASALVFPRLFFPTFDPVTGTLLSFAIFSLAFLARPVASMSGRVIQRKIGRAGKVTLALVILGSATMAIGMLPGYDSIGWWAPVLLAVLRICQGLGLGGAWDGLTLQQFVAEHDLAARRRNVLADFERLFVGLRDRQAAAATLQVIAGVS